MSDARLRRLRELFEAVRELDPLARREHLVRAEPEDAALRAEVEWLLAEAGSLQPRTGPLSDAEIDRRRSRLAALFDSAQDDGKNPDAGSSRTGAGAGLDAPTRVAGYRILRRIAAGGMGVVHEAEQQVPRRRVAIKMVHPQRGSSASAERLQREAEILARLQHPSIAQVFEAGVTDVGEGVQPWIAMEYVDGVSVTKYADLHRLDDSRRLALLASIADAVQYAHEKGVVHRDLKPDNVLVDQEGRPRILDFGVARLVGEDHGELSTMTREGQILGTLAYMAPEQLRDGPDGVGPAADVYALGVMGFELLSGGMPHDVGGVSIAAALRMLMEREPRRLDQVDPRFRGDVQTMIQRAMERDPGQRYASAAALAADLRRFLAHEPIVARPVSTIYRARKYVRRHRTLVGGVSATLLMLLAGLVASIVLGAQARDQRDRADRSATEARASEARVVSVLMDSAVRSFEQRRAWDAIDQLEAIPLASRDWGWRLLRRSLPRELDLPYEIREYADVPGVDHPHWRFLDDDRLVAVDPSSGDLAIVSLRDEGDRIRRFVGLGLVGNAAPTATGLILAWSAAEAFVLDVAAERIVERWPLAEPVEGGSLSDDGRVAALRRAGDDWVVRRDADRTMRFTVPRLGAPRLDRLLVAPDGRSLFVNRYDALEIVDVASGDVARIAPRPPFDRIAGRPLAEGWIAHQWREAQRPESWTVRVSGTEPALGDAAMPESGAGLLATTTRDGALAALNSRGGIVLRRTDGAALPRLSPLQERDGRFAAGNRYVTVPTISPTGRRVLVYSTERGPWLLELDARHGDPGYDSRCLTYRGHRGIVYHLAVSHDGSMVASADPVEPAIRVWDARTLETIAVLDRAVAEHGSRDALLAFTPDDDALVATTPIAGSDHVAVVRWNLLDGTRTTRATEVAAATGNHLLALDPFLEALGPAQRGRLNQKTVLLDGRAIALDRDYASAFGWPASPLERSGAAWTVLPQPDPAPLYDPTGITIHPTRDLVATVGPFAAAPGAANDRGQLVLRSAADGALRRVVELDCQAWCAAWSPDGSRIAIGTNQGRVRIVETEFFTATLEFGAHNDYVYSIAWMPDGHRLVTASGDGTLRIWDDRPIPERDDLVAAWRERLAQAAARTDLADAYASLTGDVRTAARIERIRRAAATN